MVKSTWTNRGVHLKTDQMDYYSGYRAAIVAVNSSRGVISYQVYNSAVNEGIFIEFLEKMSEAMGSEAFALFMDRLTVHRMLTVKAKMLELNILPVYNIPASPETNAIETCFA